MMKKPRTFNETDIVTDPREMWELRLHNPIIHHCLSHYEKGDITWEQALMSSCKFLATQNKNMFDELVKAHTEKNFPEIK